MLREASSTSSRRLGGLCRMILGRDEFSREGVESFVIEVPLILSSLHLLCVGERGRSFDCN